MMELCERCHHPKQALQLATLELCDQKIRACLRCVREIAGALRYVKLSERVTYLRKEREDWRESYEKRVRRAS